MAGTIQTQLNVAIYKEHLAQKHLFQAKENLRAASRDVTRLLVEAGYDPFKFDRDKYVSPTGSFGGDK